MNTRHSSTQIWIGSEWGPIREMFGSFLHESWPTPPTSAAIIASSLGADSPAGRVNGWVARHLTQAGIAPVERQPGDTFALRHVPGRAVIGITELLLDPVPSQVDQLYALGIWSRFAPRRKRLLMRVTPYLNEEIVENAALAAPALLLQVAEWQGQRVLIASADSIAAEVVGRALRAVAQPAGDIGETPWQSELVRIASERGLGVTSGPRIALEVYVAGRMPPLLAAEFVALAQAVARLVDCGLRLPD